MRLMSGMLHPSFLLAGVLGIFSLGGGFAGEGGGVKSAPFLRSSLLFPLESWHNHGSTIVETPDGDLLVCWFHGSGERKADDVIIEGARLRRGGQSWGRRFTLADTPDFPDGNPCMFIDPKQRLWLIHTTILANTWESALLKVYVSSDYRKNRPPRWEESHVLHLKPGPEFEQGVATFLPRVEELVRTLALTDEQRQEAKEFLDAMKGRAEDKLYRRLGWMTRAHPTVLAGGRILVPLYHDGFSFSLVAFTDDLGKTWQTSGPILGAGNVQPAVVQRADGSLYALMRDNGPPPKRLLESESRDGGRTWNPARDSGHLNPGSGADLIRLRNGSWVLINNDTETGRHQLVVCLSEDEGRTWPWRRYLEKDVPGPEAGSYHYPSIIQSRDGTLHASYSYHLNRQDLPRDGRGEREGKSIKHAHFNEAWIKTGLP